MQKRSPTEHLSVEALKVILHLQENFLGEDFFSVKLKVFPAT